MARKISSIQDLQLDKNNANKGTDRGRQLLEKSLSKLGAGRSIVCDKHGTVIGGNKTLAEAQRLGIEIEVIHTQGDKLVAVIRDDLDLETDPRARELALADNRIAELDLNWDAEQVLQDIDSISSEGLWTKKELEQLQDGLDLAAFEGIASGSELDEIDNAQEQNPSNRTESDMVPFHCLLTQQQRERLFEAIKQAKLDCGLETTAEALDAIAPPELELLKLSILEDGWTQPIVTLPEQDGRFVIVDGYHRWKISATEQVYALTGGLLPTVQLALDPIHRQLSTIRHNRARGTHAVLKMAEIVRSILADGVSEKELMQRLGMEQEEVARLNNRAGMPDQIKATSFNSAWVPRRADSP